MDKLPLDDMRWCPMLEAIKLRTAQLGDRDLAIMDLERAIESGKLRGIRWSCGTGERESLTGSCIWLFDWFYGYGNLDDWQYSVWKPDLDALVSVSQADPGVDSDPKEPAEGDGWQVRNVKALLPIAFPDGVPADATNKEIQRRLVPLCNERNWKLPSVESIRRARGRRRRQ